MKLHLRPTFVLLNLIFANCFVHTVFGANYYSNDEDVFGANSLSSGDNDQFFPFNESDWKSSKSKEREREKQRSYSDPTDKCLYEKSKPVTAQVRQRSNSASASASASASSQPIPIPGSESRRISLALNTLQDAITSNCDRYNKPNKFLKLIRHTKKTLSLEEIEETIHAYPCLLPSNKSYRDNFKLWLTYYKNGVEKFLSNDEADYPPLSTLFG